jgi:phosphopantetheine adenylyltransferase
MTEATSVGVTVKDYWEIRKKELSVFVDDLTYDEDKVLQLREDVGNANQAASFEYSYTYNGTKHKTYQVLAITVFRGYVFTYTATENNYPNNLSEVENIVKGLNF